MSRPASCSGVSGSTPATASVVDFWKNSGTISTTPVEATHIVSKLNVLRGMGHPYTDEDIAGARKALEGKSEQDALIAYLQGLGTALKRK